jgi:antirestriction protein ArdC
MATKSKKKGITSAQIYQKVTDRIVKALEEGTVPWKRPWKVQGGVHINLKSKRTYRGVNQFLLDLSAMVGQYSSPYWLTLNQANEYGGKVRKGEKATTVVFFKPIIIETDEVDEKTGEKKRKRIALLKYYNVFNVEQIDGLDPKYVPQPEKDEQEFTPIERAEKLIKGMPNLPKLSHGGDRAAYNPMTDAIRLPKHAQFDSPEHYYLTSFHEHVHSTGHESRLHRVKDWAGFGSDPYAREELVAEMGAAMLAAVTGIENGDIEENTNAYIANWLKRLKDDPKLVVQAGAAAQKAADYIQDIQFEKGEDNE